MAENAPTPNYNFNLPLVGGDDNAWGDMLNENWSSIDSILWTVSGVASAALTQTAGDARYLRQIGGTVGPNSLIVNGPSSFTNYMQVTGQFVSSGGATFGTGQVFFNSPVTFSANALGVTPPNADNSNLIPTTSWVNQAVSAAIGAIPPPGVGEAPQDGRQYARQNAAWSAVVSAPPVTVSATPPASPVVGQLWWDTVGGQLFVWYNDGNSSQWVIAVNAASQPPPASTTVLGSVKVDGTSIRAATDGTISTVLVPMGDNRIINGDMRIDQRNNGVTGSAINVYTIDRWYHQGVTASRGNWRRDGNASSWAIGFSNFHSFISSSAYNVVAGDTFNFQQRIEADQIADFAWGTVNAQPVTLSFWATSNMPGTFGGAISNGNNATRSYPFSFPLTNAWTKVVINIPGDTAGTWALQGNGEGARLFFDLGTGATYRAPAGTWAAGNYTGANGTVSVLGTNGATFNITGVKLEIGSVATPYNRQSLAKSLADCQRYYEVCYAILQIDATASTNYWVNVPYAVEKRASPTVASLTQASSGSGGFGTRASGGPSGVPTRAAIWGGQNTTTGAAHGFSDTFSASAEL